MWDDRTGSVWTHLDGLALGGPLEGTQLAIRPLQTTTWEAWLAEHPDSTVIDVDTGYQYRRTTRIGALGIGRTFLDSLDGIDERLPANEFVIGVLAGDESVAFPLSAAPEAAPMQATVGGVPVVVLEDIAGVPALAYHRALTDGRVLDFERRDGDGDDAGGVFDTQTGSRWTASGLAVEGALEGVQLTFVTSFFTEWYGWAAFHPQTTIFAGGA